MRTAIIALVTTIALLASVTAAPRKVLVLPLDGDAPAAQKSQLDEAVATMARTKLAGDITVGDTTFAETAAAVGCDAQDPACAETVRATLAVDELVYGTATTQDGNTTVMVYRVTQGAPAVSQVVVIGATDAGAQAAPGLEPVFGGGGDTVHAGPPAGSATGSDAVSGPLADPGAAAGSVDGLAEGSDTGSAAGSATERPQLADNFFDTRERKLGVGLAGGGVIALVIGLSLWASADDRADQIDDHPRRTLDDLHELAQLEDRAGSRALWGNIMVGLGLGLAGAGAYYLYKDHQNRTTTLAPAPAESGTGMTLVFAGRW